jgi:hypothetical protein
MTEKTCAGCKITKPVTEFAKNKCKKDGLQGHCRPCKKVSDRKYYLNTPQKNPQRKAFKVEQTLKNQILIREYLQQHPCVDCGNPDWRVLEFDHREDVVKVKSISTMIKGYSIEKIMEEIEKCDVRCANCHRIVTYERAKSWRSL